jgi:hypothetical protein
MEERPEKCPIETCEYHTKGFARKYDKNRHALTHYKGTMVCPFCPLAGTAYEKAFNRADVFKRHLTAVHNVEQTPPNQRKTVVVTGPGGTISAKAGGTGADVAPEGKNGARCSICHAQFATAQEFYEHVDDCVLSVVVPGTPQTGGTRKESAAAAATKVGTGAGVDKGKGPEVWRDEEGDEEGSERETRAGGGRHEQRRFSAATGEEEEEHERARSDEGAEAIRKAAVQEDKRPPKPGLEREEKDVSPPRERAHSAAARSDEREDDSMEIDVSNAAAGRQGPEVTLGSPASAEDKMDTDP